MTKDQICTLLKNSTALTALTLLLAAGVSPARAQEAAAGADQAPASTSVSTTAGTDAAAVPVANAAEAPDQQEIVVTGSLFRRTRTETPSPVTVLSSESLARRGLTNVADAVRSLSADNSGSVPTAFSGGFATGAAGVSLRGLSVNSTLTLFDGLRGAYYPLADDGQRSFVDLNTIPEVVVDRIEVLRDGASSTYGADAIGGVVNVITRKSFEGVQASAEAGVSQRGDAGEQRLTFLAGTGDLKESGWNAYLAGEYQHDGLVMAKDRGFPFNTTDLSSIGGDNNNTGVAGAGSSISAVVRPATLAIPGNIFSGVPVAGAKYQILNPAGCAPGLIRHDAANGSFCEQNYYGDYSVVQPRQTRFGVTGRVSARLTDAIDGYAMATYYQNDVFSPGFPLSIRQNNPLATTAIVLPARLTNGQLNPNNPFAAQGLAAQVFYRFGDIPQTNETLSRTWRGAVGLSGSLGGGFTFTADATAMHTGLDITRTGYLSIPALVKAINEGTYNFVDPSKNSQAVRDALAPTIRTKATSDLYLAQATVAKELAQLPGGPLQLGIGFSARYEKVGAPNANPNAETLALNAYSASGHHTVTAAYAELNAPILDQFEINASGRFDHYSEGYSRFSPKIGFKATPVRELAVRGTYSQGFRAPQFAETSGQVVGYITAPPLPCSVILAHGGTAKPGGGCSGGSAYVTGAAALGINSVANPEIKPETSRSFTLGTVFQPVKWFSATLDYYNIRKRDVILAGPDYGVALAAYYDGKPLPPGYTVTLSGVDPEHPNAIRTVGVVNAPYVNAASLATEGLDFTANVQARLGAGIKLSSTLEVTDILKYKVTTASGAYDYLGTQGPYQLSSGAGTPKWRGSWSNSLEWGRATLTATANYTSGYRSTADDVTGPGTAGDCANALYGQDFCRTKAFIDVDLVGSYDVGEHLSLWFNIVNLFDAKPPLNPANYAGLNYNPTWSQQGMIGRTFRAGAKVKF